MITKSIQTLSGRIKLRIPENLSEVTLAQMIAMQNETGNAIPLIPDLTEEVVNNIVSLDDLLQIRERVLSLAHQIKYAYTSDAIPEKLMGVKVPRNLSIEPAGAYLVSRDLIADEINRHIGEFGEDEWKDHFTPNLDVCAGVIANYLYCRVTRELWSEQKAEAFKEQVLQLPVSEALPVAAFFYRSYPNMFQPRMSPWVRFRLRLKRELALRRLRNSDGSML